MPDFRTLDLAVEFYLMAEQIPIRGHLRDQFIRAACSIALNLSEGNAKPSVKEKRRFFQIAYASCQECKTILKLAKIRDQKIDQLLDHVSGSSYKLMTANLSTIKVQDSDRNSGVS